MESIAVDDGAEYLKYHRSLWTSSKITRVSKSKNHVWGKTNGLNNVGHEKEEHGEDIGGSVKYETFEDDVGHSNMKNCEDAKGIDREEHDGSWVIGYEEHDGRVGFEDEDGGLVVDSKMNMEDSA